MATKKAAKKAPRAGSQALPRWVYERPTQFEVKIRLKGVKERVVYPFTDATTKAVQRSKAIAYAEQRRSELGLTQYQTGESPWLNQTLMEWINEYEAKVLAPAKEEIKVYEQAMKQGKVPKDKVPRHRSADHQSYSLYNLCTLDPKTMNIPVRELRLTNFTGANGLLRKIKGKKIKGTDEHEEPASATLRKYIAHLNSLWSYGVQHWDLPFGGQPWKGAKIDTKDPKHKPQAIPDEDFQRVMACVTRHPRSIHPLFEFLRWTACRKAEAVRLMWEDIRWPSDDSLPIVLPRVEN